MQLQTNFGGGKTHSLIALYHLAGGHEPASLPGVEEMLAESGFGAAPEAKRAVLVGQMIDPASPRQKPDGTMVTAAEPLAEHVLAHVLLQPPATHGRPLRIADHAPYGRSPGVVRLFSG